MTGANGREGLTGSGPHAARIAAAATTLILAVIYGLTTAPSVTWWDAGEFVAAADALGIPHPPGTPLYILIANRWSAILGALDRAHAVNLLSAACTAAAGGFAAWILARATGRAALGVAAALCAGTMATVWSSATEAEVYGPALLLAMLMLAAGERAGATGEGRFVVLMAYCFALAAPLHVMALVAGPSAVVLAATRPDGNLDRRSGVILTLALVASGAVGTGRWWLGAAALVALIAVVCILRRSRLAPVVVVVALSAFAFMLLRAQHDPGINQGNSATIPALLAVISREQYTIAGLLPRQAPVWLQVVNFLQYADWQVALGLGPTVTPTIGRMAVTIAYIALGAFGFAAHRRADRRTWRALVVLGLCGSIGVLAYLNLKAGPSIGYGILPDDAPHEPRERDYFFAYAFWTWGLWAGIGAVHLAQRWFAPRRSVAIAAGLGVALLPAVLNWRALDRRRQPDAALPRAFAEEMLRSAPPRAVLVVAGDNDSYPLWFLQQAEDMRRDVLVVTYPLLGAGWYRDELYRRALIGFPPPHDHWRGLNRELASIAASAEEQGRPLAVAVTVERSIREMVGPRWRLAGLAYVAAGADDFASGAEDTDRLGGIDLDRDATEASAARLQHVLRSAPRAAIDPTGRIMRGALTCPSLALRVAEGISAPGLLESTCNSR